jgi:peptide/nickel transport system substrate-binding protein
MPQPVSIVGVTQPSRARKLAALVLALVLAATGCSGGYQDLPEARAARVGATSDMNPQDPATLRDGGNLRLPLTAFPDNFNQLNIDGNTSDTAESQYRLLHRCRADRDQPPDRHVHDQSESHVERR